MYGQQLQRIEKGQALRKISAELEKKRIELQKKEGTIKSACLLVSDFYAKTQSPVCHSSSKNARNFLMEYFMRLEALGPDYSIKFEDYGKTDWACCPSVMQNEFKQILMKERASVDGITEQIAKLENKEFILKMEVEKIQMCIELNEIPEKKPKGPVKPSEGKQEKTEVRSKPFVTKGNSNEYDVLSL